MSEFNSMEEVIDNTKISQSSNSAQDINLDSAPPKIFISYSHDTQEHKERVLALADRLREDGIDSNIDQYEDSPPEGWQRWMLNQVEVADYALIICTRQYDRRFRGQEETGKGKGVTWEGGVIIQELYDAQGKNSKFIPVTFAPEDSKFIPSPLRSATFYRLDTVDGYEQLYRRLTNQPRTRKADLGKLRTLPPCERKQSFSNIENGVDTSNVRQEKQQLNPSVKDRLIDILLEIPSFSMQDSRSILLRNLPPKPISTVNRSSALMVDIHNIVYAASAWGRLESGKLALVVLIENALLFARGTELGHDLEKLLAELRGET